MFKDEIPDFINENDFINNKTLLRILNDNDIFLLDLAYETNTR